MSATLVFDEKLGLAFEGYNAELLRAFLILVHYTDLDIAQYDNPQGRYDVYDAIASHRLWEEIMDIVDSDMADVDDSAYKLERSAKENFERQHALSYKLGQVFESLLGTENLTETVAKAEGLNSALIDMLGALQKEKAAKPTVGGSVMQFAKKK